MYQKIKQIIKSLIPANFIHKNELFFRSLHYPFYYGSKYQCNICNKRLRKFIQIKNGTLLCPACGSVPRNRRLWSILKTDFLKKNIKILHFSPSRSLYRKLKKESSIDYTSSDFAGEFFGDKQLDITKIDEQSNSFDLIICYHVLEHIEDDHKAMSELYRVLKKDGHCLIQTPYKNGDIFEDASIKTPQERLKHFGQTDHVRIYSATGLKTRLSNVGFNAEIKEFKEEPYNYNGFKENEIVIIAKK